MNIGFDLDGIFIDKPPFIPKSIIERLYVKDHKQLMYRIPSRFEQLVRKMAHLPMLRPPITANIKLIIEKGKHNAHRYYLVSGRFGFLQKETKAILKKNNLDKIFNTHYINNRNQQPHIFKNAMLKKLMIHRYVDDDLTLLEFLAGKNPRTIFFWLNNSESKKISKNLFSIKELSEIFR